MSRYDCCIVGGGIGGPALALLLVRRGLKVALIDEGKIGRNRLSTHFVWPRGVSYLKHLGLLQELQSKSPLNKNMTFRIEDVVLTGSICNEETLARMQQIHSQSVETTEFYTCIRRQYLDRILLEKCQTGGVDVFIQAKVDRVVSGDGRLAAVKTKEGRTFYADYFVAADGRESTLARLLHLPLIDHRPISTSCVWSYFETSSPLCLRLSRVGREGFGAVSTSDGLTMILVWGARERAKNYLTMSEHSFRSQVERLDPEVAQVIEKRCENFYRVVNLDAQRRASFYQNVLFVGDAASFKDQCSASGITHALRDAFLASNAIFGGKLQDLRTYDSLRTRDHAAYFEMVCDHARMNPFTDHEIEHFRSLPANSTHQFFATLGDSNSINTHHQEISHEFAAIA